MEVAVDGTRWAHDSKWYYSTRPYRTAELSSIHRCCGDVSLVRLSPTLLTAFSNTTQPPAPNTSSSAKNSQNNKPSALHGENDRFIVNIKSTSAVHLMKASFTLRHDRRIISLQIRLTSITISSTWTFHLDNIYTRQVSVETQTVCPFSSHFPLRSFSIFLFTPRSTAV